MGIGDKITWIAKPWKQERNGHKVYLPEYRETGTIERLHSQWPQLAYVRLNNLSCVWVDLEDCQSA